MRRQLRRDGGVAAPLATLYDRPTAAFVPVAPAQRRAIREALVPAAQRERLDRGRLKVVVSSTSWTPDEDFSILLDALVAYAAARAAATPPDLPELCVVITGKGPLKADYLARIAALRDAGRLAGVSVQTPWFPSVADYVRALGAADLGVSLHTSSSGVDLPMKVVDMLGAGLPVVGWGRYEAWGELVREGVNGRGFGSSEELAALLVELMGDDGALKPLQQGALREGRRRWEEEWDECAGRMLGIVK